MTIWNINCNTIPIPLRYFKGCYGNINCFVTATHVFNTVSVTKGNLRYCKVKFMKQTTVLNYLCKQGE